MGCGSLRYLSVKKVKHPLGKHCICSKASQFVIAARLHSSLHYIDKLNDITRELLDKIVVLLAAKKSPS